MNEKKSPPGSEPSGVAALESKVSQMRQSMAAQQARIARGSMIIAGVGSVLCVGMAVWFYLGLTWINELTTPKKIVQAAEAIILDKLPDARKALESQINDQADEWAANVSGQVQDNIPAVRGHLEDFIMSKTGEELGKLQVVTAQQFRSFLSENNGMMNDGFMSLKKKDEAEKFVADLNTAVAKNMSHDVREQSEDMLHMVIQLNKKLDVLKRGEKLDEEQVLEREIMSIAKRLQIEDALDSPAKRPKKSNNRLLSDEPEEAKTEEAGDKPAEETSPAKEEPKEKDKEAKSSEPEKKSGDN